MTYIRVAPLRPCSGSPRRTVTPPRPVFTMAAAAGDIKVYGEFDCTHYGNSMHQVGDGTKKSFMDKDILKDIANEAIKQVMARNKQAKVARPVKVTVDTNGATFKDAKGEAFVNIAAMTFHCLVMGKKSGWSKKQTAVIMERDVDGKSVVARVVEFPKKNLASQMFDAFVALMTYLKGQYDAAKNAEKEHEEAPEDEDAEYLSIMLS
mmetsp:Transcript_31075/g.81389  ORF Transcript_31075/g.81389 Transcript_31075/m.81389 type:complete len:207 (-) Transcript_31075:260-880(-)